MTPQEKRLIIGVLLILLVGAVVRQRRLLSPPVLNKAEAVETLP